MRKKRRGQGVSAEAAEPDEPVVLTPGYLCARCGNSFGSTSSAKCQRCGLVVTRQMLEAANRERNAVAAWGSLIGGSFLRSGAVRAVCGWFAALVALTAGAFLFVPERGTFAEVMPFVVMAVVGLGWVSGPLIARLRRHEDRASMVMRWQKSLWLLHAPWLGAPAYAALALAIGIVDLSGEFGGWAYWPVLMMVWAVGCPLAMAAWWDRNSLRRKGDKCGRWSGVAAESVMFVIGGVTMVFTSLYGFFVWVIVVAWIGSLLDVGPGPIELLEILSLGGL